MSGRKVHIARDVEESMCGRAITWDSGAIAPVLFGYRRAGALDALRPHISAVCSLSVHPKAICRACLKRLPGYRGDAVLRALGCEQIECCVERGIAVVPICDMPGAKP